MEARNDNQNLMSFYALLLARDSQPISIPGSIQTDESAKTSDQVNIHCQKIANLHIKVIEESKNKDFNWLRYQLLTLPILPTQYTNIPRGVYVRENETLFHVILRGNYTNNQIDILLKLIYSREDYYALYLELLSYQLVPALEFHNQKIFLRQIYQRALAENEYEHFKYVENKIWEALNDDYTLTFNDLIQAKVSSRRLVAFVNHWFSMLNEYIDIMNAYQCIEDTLKSTAYSDYPYYLFKSAKLRMLDIKVNGNDLIDETGVIEFLSTHRASLAYGGFGETATLTLWNKIASSQHYFLFPVLKGGVNITRQIVNEAYGQHDKDLNDKLSKDEELLNATSRFRIW